MPLHWNQAHLRPTTAPRQAETTRHGIGTSLTRLFAVLWTESTRGKGYPGTRRSLTISLLLALALTAAAQTPQTPTPDQAPLDPALGITTLRLWPGPAPDAKGDTAADTPTLTVFRPNHPNGTAVIIAPGGGYTFLAANYEGRQEADTLAEWGVTTFVLRYRLGPTYLYPVPLEDSRRAVRLVRSLAGSYGYSPDRIGMMGFSAGGHLAAMTAVTPDSGNPTDPDPVNRLSDVLNFQLLIYPWLNAMQPQVASPYAPGKPMINYCSVTKGLTQADCARLDPQYSPTAHVSANTPAAFILDTTDDKIVSVAETLRFYTAMLTAADDAELHLFAHGPHGFGTGAPDPVLEQWLPLLENWMRARGLLRAQSH